MATTAVTMYVAVAIFRTLTAGTSAFRWPGSQSHREHDANIPADDEHGQPDGSRLARFRPGQVSTINVERRRSLSAIGSSHAPRVVFWPDRRAMSPSRPFGDAGGGKDDSRQPKCPYTTRITNAESETSAAT